MPGGGGCRRANVLCHPYSRPHPDVRADVVPLAAQSLLIPSEGEEGDVVALLSMAALIVAAAAGRRC